MSSTRPAVAVAVLAWAVSVVALWLVTDAGALGVDLRARHPGGRGDRPVLLGGGRCWCSRAPAAVGSAGCCSASACCGAGAALSSAVLVAATGPSPLVRVAESVESWIWVGGFVPLLTLVPLLYPDGRLPGPRWRPWVVTSAAGMVLLAIASATYPGGCLGAALPRGRPHAGAVLRRRDRRAGGPMAARGGAGSPPDRGLAGHRRRAGRRHPAPAAAGLAGGRPEPGGGGRLGTPGHRRRRDPAPALRPRPGGLPRDRRSGPRGVPGRRSTSACSCSPPPCCPAAPPSARRPPLPCAGCCCTRSVSG